MKRNSNSNEPQFKRGLTEDEINSPEFNPDDFAPAPDTEKGVRENEALESKRNALVFAFVTAFFAIVIGLSGWASVKSVTAYNDNVFENYILSMYSNCDSLEEYKTEHEGYEINAVFYGNKMAGYCVYTTVEGFGGDIDILVAFNSKNEISDVKILDHNESRGLGSKIEGDKFLSQFIGLLIGSGNNEYDIIAGATASSDAVCNAIDEILKLGLSTDSIANELGYETISAEEIEKEAEKDEQDKDKDKNNNKKPSSQRPSDTTSDRNNNGLGGYQGGQNSNNGSGNIGADGEDVTTVYETETKRPDDDETTGPEETTKAPEETTAKPAETTGKAETTAPPADTKPDTTAPETTAPPVDTAPDTTAPEETTVPSVTEPSVTTAPEDTDPVPSDPTNPAGGDN